MARATRSQEVLQGSGNPTTRNVELGGSQIITGDKTFTLPPRLDSNAVVDQTNHLVPKSYADLVSDASIANDHGYLGWSAPMYASNTSSLLSVGSGAGIITVVRCRRLPASTVTNVIIMVTSAGSGLTVGQCFAALYTASGILIGVTADQATAWQSTGVKPMPLVGGPFSIPAGDYHVGLWYNGTTAPTLLRAGLGFSGAQTNAGQSTANCDVATANTGLTTTAPDPLGAKTVGALLWWTAIN